MNATITDFESAEGKSATVLLHAALARVTTEFPWVVGDLDVFRGPSAFTSSYAEILGVFEATRGSRSPFARPEIAVRAAAIASRVSIRP